MCPNWKRFDGCHASRQYPNPSIRLSQHTNTDNDKQHTTNRTLKGFLKAKREFNELNVRD
jgi:hypothetical protein